MLLAALVLQACLVSGCAALRPVRVARRSVAVMQPAGLPMSKGGWRPVIGSGAFPAYAVLSAAPLTAPKYKIPVPVSMDSHPTSSNPASVREPNKLTSIAQSYKPTTLRSLPIGNYNAPVSSYLNPFALQNGGMSHYKILQNYPETVVIRNPGGQYQARPVYKQQIQGPNKFKPLNGMIQQYSPNNFHMYATTVRIPQDQFSKPVEVYVRPSEGAKKPENYGRPEVKKPGDAKNQDSYKPETYKLEVYKVPDNAGSQSVSPQQVKTAQQAMSAGTLKPPTTSQFHQYIKEEKFSPIPTSILGTLGTYSAHSMKPKDPVVFGAKTTYIPSVPTRHTVFNSFGYTPVMHYQEKFVTSTPKTKPSQNHIVFNNYANNVKAGPVQTVKQNPLKAEHQVPVKVNFKASPQDPFSKPIHQTHVVPTQQQYSVYHPLRFSPFPHYTFQSTVPPTTAQTSIFNNNPLTHRFVSQLNPPYTTFSTYYGHHAKPHFDQNKQTVHTVTPTVSVHNDLQYSKPPKNQVLDATPQTVPFRATYDVTETYDIETQPPNYAWMQSPDHTHTHHDTDPSQTVIPHTIDNPTDLPEADLSTQYNYAADGNDNKHYNSLTYDTDVEPESHRPLGNDFEQNQYVGKHKLRDHYYKVTTPSYTDSSTKFVDYEITTRRHHYREHTTKANDINGQSVELATLPPNKHFKRPHPVLEFTEKERTRKKNKNRRRRPTPVTPEREEINEQTTTAPTIEVYTTEPDGSMHTVRPRVKLPAYNKPKPTTYSPPATTDLSTSAVPTVSPTTPTVVIRKKLAYRRTTTPLPNEEDSTVINKGNDKNSSIMKIANRPPSQRQQIHSYDVGVNETPDYSHKQDEKDTPTSDISVNTNINDNDEFKPFDFHVHVKPIDNTVDHPTTPKLEISQIDDVSQDDFDKNQDDSELVTTTPKTDNSSHSGKLRPRLKNKYESNRPRFSVKDYRNRMSSTTTTEKTNDVSVQKLRFPQRRLPVYNENKYDVDNSTEQPRKKFTPKEPRHKPQDFTTTESTSDKPLYSTRSTIRHRPESSNSEAVLPKISSRIRGNSRTQSRSRTTEEPVEQSSPSTVHIKRPQRKKNKEADSISEGSEDVAVTESSHKDESTSERQRSESAIMKIAKDDKKPASDAVENSLSEHSRRVSDLTHAASKDYNTPGMFKTVSPNSRRIPNYFTIATDDPILPIEAFFPQLNQKKDS